MRKTLAAFLLLLITAMCLSCATGETPSKAEGANALACGSDQIEVRFLHCAKKSDASIVLVRTKSGTEVVLVDGGLSNNVCHNELLELRGSWLEAAGIDPDESGLRLHLTLVVTHFHTDHVRELIDNIIPDGNFEIDAVYLCEESALPDDFTNSEPKHREPFMAALEKYAPEATITTVAFDTTLEVELSYGTMTLFAPCMDFGTEEGRAYIAKIYYPTYSQTQLKETIATAVLNSNSLFVKFSTQGGSVLFPGDVMKKKSGRSDEPLDLMIQRYGEALRADIVKYPHHGLVRNAAVTCIRDSLLKENGVAIVTGPESSEAGGAMLKKYSIPWVTAETQDQIFVIDSLGWSCTTAGS